MFDIIIIGAGPAGLTAGIYALRANKKIKILEKEGIGGQMASSPLIENYPGIKSISGSELANNLYEQILSLGGDVELETVTKIVPGKIKKVITEDNEYEAKSVIIAAGAKYRLIGLEKEEDFIGNGISFCVSCDGAFYKEKTVAVIGGGNSAIINAISLCDIAKKVYVIQNLSDLTGEDLMSKTLKQKKNAEIICDATVTLLLQEDGLSGIIINHKGNKEKIDLDGMFVSIGQVPSNELLKDIVPLDKYGYASSDDACKTNYDNIFVSGDIRQKAVKQLTTATSDGTVAAICAINYLNKEA